MLKHVKAVAAKAEQRNLDEMFQSKPTEFSRDGVLRVVAEFVVCDNQVCGAAVCLQCDYRTYRLIRALWWQTKPHSEIA